MLLFFAFCFLVVEAAVTKFTSKPSNPTFVLVGQDITLVWSYTLDGRVGVVRFFNVTDGVRDEMGKTFSPGNLTMWSSYQARFRAEASGTRTQLRILRIQTSDQGKYEFDIWATGVGSLQHVVEVIVQCKY